MILAAIRDSAGSVVGKAEAIHAEAALLLQQTPRARPVLFDESPVSAFIQRINRGDVIGTQCSCVDSIEDAPQSIAGYIGGKGLGPQISIWESSQLANLDWRGFKISHPVDGNDSVSVVLADSAVAETGSVVVNSGYNMPILMNFLCSHLVVVVRSSGIVAYLDDYAESANINLKNRTTPRTSCLVTGASGTTDIEGVLVRGAHGPKSVYIVLVLDKP